MGAGLGRLSGRDRPTLVFVHPALVMKTVPFTQEVHPLATFPIQDFVLLVVRLSFGGRCKSI
jgi:hypothetical protein